MSKWLATILALIAVTSWGCALSHMETSRQLESGETVVHVGMEPEALFVPRVVFNVMQGFGAGDVSIHGGAGPWSMIGGLGMRAYLSEGWMGSLQTKMVHWLEDGESWVVGTPRLIYAARSPSSSLYFGAQIPVMNYDRECCSVVPGLVFGGEDFRAGGWNPQFEVVLSIWPFVGWWGDESRMPWPAIHFGANY